MPAVLQELETREWHERTLRQPIRVAPPNPGTSQAYRDGDLGWRQRRLYTHRVSVWRPDALVDGAGAPLPTSYHAILSDVPCYLETGQSNKAPQGFIYDEGDNMFTLDSLHGPEWLELRTGDVFRLTTGAEAGEYWQVRGDGQVRAEYAERTLYLCSRLPRVPPGLTE